MSRERSPHCIHRKEIEKRIKCRLKKKAPGRRARGPEQILSNPSNPNNEQRKQYT
ncbi:MAG: hypothetical protein MI923_15540 [Phycisphaerales bacterium]|nr:hypothetical protein [Phycisphaerales bacterium]